MLQKEQICSLCQQIVAAFAANNTIKPQRNDFLEVIVNAELDIVSAYVEAERT